MIAVTQREQTRNWSWRGVLMGVEHLPITSSTSLNSRPTHTYSLEITPASPPITAALFRCSCTSLAGLSWPYRSHSFNLSPGPRKWFNKLADQSPRLVRLSGCFIRLHV